MTNKRKIYLRKKGKAFVFEGKMKGKTIYIWTIPTNYEQFLRNLIKSSFFPKGKGNKLLAIFPCLDYKDLK